MLIETMTAKMIYLFLASSSTYNILPVSFCCSDFQIDNSYLFRSVKYSRFLFLFENKKYDL